jgi:hypothetical protein
VATPNAVVAVAAAVVAIATLADDFAYAEFAAVNVTVLPANCILIAVLVLSD